MVKDCCKSTIKNQYQNKLFKFYQRKFEPSRITGFPLGIVKGWTIIRVVRKLQKFGEHNGIFQMFLSFTHFNIKLADSLLLRVVLEVKNYKVGKK